MQTSNHCHMSESDILRELYIALPNADTDEFCFVAVCGQPNAGKRTFFKQLEIVANKKYRTAEERLQFIAPVQRFVIRNMGRVAAAITSDVSLINSWAYPWEMNLNKRSEFFALVKSMFQTLATRCGPNFLQIIRNVPRLDSWASEYIMDCERILNDRYIPSLEDIIRVAPWEGPLTCDVDWEGVQYRFYDYDTNYYKAPYNDYRNHKHRFVYILDFGLPAAQIKNSFEHLYPIIEDHLCPIDVFFNKTQILAFSNRQEVYDAFDLQAAEYKDYTLASIVSGKAWEEARSGRMIVRCTYSNLVQPGDGKLIKDMFNYWADPDRAAKFYQNPYPAELEE